MHPNISGIPFASSEGDYLMLTPSHQRTHSSYSILQLFFRSILPLLYLALLADPLAAQNKKDAPMLELNKPIERELAGDTAHSYRITLATNQFLHVVVQQKGIDVVVALFAPDGKKVAEVDSAMGDLDPESISLVAEATGNFLLEVRSFRKSAPSGRYEARIDALRVATTQDRARYAAEKAEEEGARIFEQDTPTAARDAIEKLKEAAALWKLSGDRVKEVLMLTGIGKAYSDLGEYQQAREYLDHAREQAQSSGNSDGEALALLLLGFVHQYLGENEAALTSASRALALAREAHNQGTEIIALRAVAQVLSDRGEKQRALDYLNDALQLSILTQDNAGEALTLGHLGATYADLGEYERALGFFDRVLPFAMRADTRAAQAQALANIAGMHNLLGRPQQALTNLRRALTLSRLGTERRVEVSVLNNIGVVHLMAGTYATALRVLRQALHLAQRIGARELEALSLYNLGRTYSAAAQKEQALTHLQRALPLWRSLSEPSYEAQTLGAIADVERRQGALDNASAHIKAALEIADTLRTKLGSLEMRASYLASVHDYYEIYIEVLMSLHAQRRAEDYATVAFQTSENGRARSLLELLTEAGTDIRQGVDPTLVERERSLRQLLSSRAQRQFQLKSGPHSDEQAQVLAKEIESLTTELQQIEAQIRLTSPRYAALTQPQSLTLKEIQTQVLDEDTILLEYSLGKDRSYLWAVTRTSITSYELPKRDEIEAAARQVYAVLTDSQQWDAKTASRQRELTRQNARTIYAPRAVERLSRMVLGPVAPQLGDKRLLIIADGALQYIPFGALPLPVGSDPTVAGPATRKGQRITDKYQPLVVQHEIVSLPSASTLAVLRKEMRDRKPAEKAVAVLADPVFESDDKRVTRGTKEAPGISTDKPQRARTRELPLGMERAATESGLKGSELRIPRLPATRDEARQILSLFPQAQSKGFLDFDASRQTATSGELSQYRYVHFATHGFLNSVHPELSGIVLSMVDEKGDPQDGFLRAHEIFNLKLPAELVVLSACQTGLGKEVKGEGLVSLTRGFMYAGAPRVVVSFWNVNDEATAELMARFYRAILKNQMRPAEALRSAQVSLMKETAWKSPFYWAAFTIQGEWR
jgi:CHAT domain-containing protein/tetratricopeptide (TPR) repeat protein